ncbi:hypothetical protein [Actinomadura geliboluensis]|uniref:Integrase n=1 Tax=Actinomadura geliboluensis TaxID=882440 RepID=A0A5S4GWN7_9ACTN|nr:hypothetical protein [Actinomadura geliboluensis]TMR37393.1 hypothetical protein ETD96_18725 [Actinomadura geliboluensis]
MSDPQRQRSTNGLACGPVAARLRELADQRAPWHRALWQPGTALALREVLEYAALVDSKAQRPEGLQYAATAAIRQVQGDPGCGPPDVRELIVNHLIPVAAKPVGKAANALPAADQFALEQLCRRVSATYLERWLEAVDGGFLATPPAAGHADPTELCARSIIAHLFDAGLSGHHLHRWITAKIAQEGAAPADLLREAIAMCADPERTYQVVVPFTRLPGMPEPGSGHLQPDVQHLSTTQLEQICAAEHLAAPRRGAGALQLRIRARDPWSAVAEAEAFAKRLTTRARLAGKDARPHDQALVIGTGRWRALETWQPPARLPSIERRSLFIPQPQSLQGIDDALELLDAAAITTSWATLAGTWAAVEGLLAQPTEPGVIAADRIAAILTCSYPRAELLSLVRAWERNGDDATADQLRTRTTRAARIDLVVSALSSGQPVPERVSRADPVSAARAIAMLNHAPTILERAREYLCSAVRRLYNQRNLIMHSGSAASVSMAATLRTAPTLVAAGIDRIVHATFDPDATSGVALAARAEAELRLLGTPGARPIHRLLD